MSALRQKKGLRLCRHITGSCLPYLVLTWAKKNQHVINTGRDKREKGNNNTLYWLAWYQDFSYPNYKVINVPFARLSFLETCGPCWQRATFGRILRKRLQALAYGRTNSSSFSASGLCHLHGLKKRDMIDADRCSLGWTQKHGMTLLSAVNVLLTKFLVVYMCFAFSYSW